MKMDQKNKILIIDDEEDIRENLQYQFSARGYEVATAQDGVDGFEKLDGVNPDLIVLDLNMPRMGGLEFYQKICDKSGNPKYSTLILTARANTEQLFKEFNIDGFIPKPFEIDDVIKESEIIIQNKKRRKNLESNKFISDSKGIFLVENDQDAFNRIGIVLLNAGYKLNTAKTGTRAIEKIMQDPPCLIIMNLRLPDIAGDIVAQKLMTMSKTSKIPFIMYIDNTGEYDKSVFEKLGAKSGILKFIRYSQPKEILAEVDLVFLQEGKT